MRKPPHICKKTATRPTISNPPRCMLSPSFYIWVSRHLEHISGPVPSLRIRSSVFALNEFVGVETTTSVMLPTRGIVLMVFYFVAIKSLARLRVIIKKIPMKFFIVSTVKMWARMLFIHLLNFLLIRILREKFLSGLVTKNRLTTHEQLIRFLSHEHWIYKGEGCCVCLCLLRSRASIMLYVLSHMPSLHFYFPIFFHPSTLLLYLSYHL